jgi:hypothetical protein
MNHDPKPRPDDSDADERPEDDPPPADPEKDKTVHGDDELVA